MIENSFENKFRRWKTTRCLMEVVLIEIIIMFAYTNDINARFASDNRFRVMFVRWSFLKYWYWLCLDESKSILLKNTDD